MPFEIEQDGKTMTVYTQDELNSAAAAARRDGAKDTESLQQKLTDLSTQLQSLSGENGNLTKQLAALTTERDGLAKAKQGITALAKQGLSIEQAEFFLAHPLLADADLTSDDGIAAVMSSIKPFIPASDPKPAPPAQALGVPHTPQREAGKPYNLQDIDGMSRQDIIANKQAVLAALAAQKK